MTPVLAMTVVREAAIAAFVPEKFYTVALTLADGGTASSKLPFGVTGRYNWLTDSVFQPYAGLKLGASYAEMSSYYYVVKQYTDTWGFFMSPEIGVSIFPRPDYRLGFHVALYYSYATNSGDVLTYSINNINNFGIRVGISF